MTYNRTTYVVRWTAQAVEMVERIRDRRVRRLVYETAARLSESPDLQGKSLGDELAGYRSIRTAGQRYRLVYRIVKNTVTVYVAAAGIRKQGDKKDVYEIAKKMLRRGQLKFPDQET